MRGATPSIPNTPSWRDAQFTEKARGQLYIFVFTGFWLGGPKVRDHWEDLGVGGR
jgi:hypothetical protein